MTKLAFDKIAAGLKDAIEGSWAGVTFVGVDIGSGPDWSAVQCPRCFAGLRWRDKAPECCPHCKVPFTFHK
jgi:hypothetical protein